jgi:ABC-type spermidine/putrescine transport system permease subunit II
MLSDDFPLRLQLLIGFTVPPVLTAVCWLIGRRAARAPAGNAGTKGKAGFWSMLIAAYVIFALALAGRHVLAKHERADPSSLLVQ